MLDQSQQQFRRTPHRRARDRSACRVRGGCNGAVSPLAIAPDEQHLVSSVDSGHLQLLDAGPLALGRGTRLDGFVCWAVLLRPSCMQRGSAPPASPSSSRMVSSGAWVWRHSPYPRMTHVEGHRCVAFTPRGVRWRVGRAVVHVARPPPKARARTFGALIASATCALWVARPAP